MERKHLVTTFYKFFSQSKEELEELRTQLLKKGEALNLKGLLLIGTEGVNATVCGLEQEMMEFKSFLQDRFKQELTFKDSWSNGNPFWRWKVKIRKEIVTIGAPGLAPNSEKNNHLSPEDWHKAVKEENVVVIDTRNTYETDIGKFKTALDPKINDFQEFSEFMKSSNIEKHKEVLIYCTGGIRCEKAILDLNNQGYENVYQLDGGILNYLKKYPNEEFEGECFVFDHRVSVDQNLNPSQRYSLCPHCGNPGDQLIECIQCCQNHIVCKHCLSQEEEKPTVRTCSKNCSYHYKLDHKTRRIHQQSKSNVKRF